MSVISNIAKIIGYKYINETERLLLHLETTLPTTEYGFFLYKFITFFFFIKICTFVS
jgi:hypothetical protein